MYKRQVWAIPPIACNSSCESTSSTAFTESWIDSGRLAPGIGITTGLLSLSPVVIPIPGASRPESIADSARAATLELTHEELQAIGGIAQTA